MGYSKNWKVAGPDHIQGVWFKKTTSLHPKLKQHLQECVNIGQVPTGMEGGTVLIMKDKQRDSCRKLQTKCLPSTDVDKSTFSEVMYRYLSK